MCVYGCGWVLWNVYRGFAYLVGTRVSRVQGRSRAGWSRASPVLGSTTTTTTHGVLGRFAGPSVLDEVSPYLARLRWGHFQTFPNTKGERTGRGCLTTSLLPTSMELLPDPAETFCLLGPHHPAWDQGQGSVPCHRRGLHSLMIKLNSTIIQSSDSLTTVAAALSTKFIFIKTCRCLLEKAMQHPTPVLLPGKSHGWRSPVVCSP